MLFFRWCRLLRWTKLSQVIVIVVDSASASDFNKYSLPFMSSQFEMVRIYKLIYYWSRKNIFFKYQIQLKEVPLQLFDATSCREQEKIATG